MTGEVCVLYTVLLIQIVELDRPFGRQNQYGPLLPYHSLKFERCNRPIQRNPRITIYWRVKILLYMSRPPHADSSRNYRQATEFPALMGRPATERPLMAITARWEEAVPAVIGDSKIHQRFGYRITQETLRVGNEIWTPLPPLRACHGLSSTRIKVA